MLNHQIRPTPIRINILNLFKQHHLLSADDIFTHVNTDGSTDRVTVYRTLELLKEHDLLCEHHFGNRSAVYELRDHHHDHLVCTTCGQIQSMPCQLVLPTNINHFKPYHHHLAVYGQCSKCQEAI
jgi:Fur family transcriptional regulator, ferric uptake regulator